VPTRAGSPCPGALEECVDKSDGLLDRGRGLAQKRRVQGRLELVRDERCEIVQPFVPAR
jgi:hypothetical protein